MLACFWVSEPLSEAKINDINVMLLFPDTNQKIVRFDISVEKVPRVNKLDSLKHLIRQHQNCFQAEFPLTIIQKVFKRRPKQIDDHDVVITFYPKPVHIWYTNTALQNPIKLSFVKQLRVLRSDGL